MVYNEEDAKTHREKFREKILKLINNELPIDYLKPVKVDGKFVMTYKGHPLDKVQYPTKRKFPLIKRNLLFLMITAKGNLWNSIKIFSRTNYNIPNNKSLRIVRRCPPGLRPSQMSIYQRNLFKTVPPHLSIKLKQKISINTPSTYPCLR